MSQTTENIGLYLEDDANARFKNWREKINGPVDSNMIKIDRAIASKQNKLLGTAGQIPVFGENGEIIAKNPEETGVVSFNGRKGLVIPQTGDYSADDILMPDGTSVSTAYSNIRGKLTGRNLLDNAFFVGGGTAGRFPIIQRGITTHNQVQGKKTYTLDRWWNFDAGTFTVTEAGIECSAGLSWEQNIAPWALPLMYDKIITASAFGILNGKSVGMSYTGVYDKTVGSGGIHGILGNIGVSGSQYADSLGGPYFELRYAPAFTLIALKVELGPVSTLYHKDVDGNLVLNDPPLDYCLELAKCQRYQLILANQEIIPYGSPSIFGRVEYNGELSLFIPTPVELRANPVIKGDAISVVGNHTVVQMPTVNTTGRKDSNGVFFSISGDFSAIGNMEAVSANVKNLTIDSNL